MSTVSSGDELINIAIDIERRGISFYDVIAKSSDNEMARAVFEDLVAMEREHLRVFQGMLSGAEESQPREAAARGYPGYLQSLIDEAVFSDDMITGEIATQADNDVKAIELGIGSEKDSILFYYEMRDSLPRRLTPMVDMIIAEEKTHLQQLSEIKKKLAAT
jgi:rubrerythrin